MTQNIIGGRPKIYSSAALVGGTPQVCDVYTDLGKYGRKGRVKNTSETVDLRVYYSSEGTYYNGGATTGSTEYQTLKAFGAGAITSEYFDFDGVQLKKIKVDCAGGSTGSYEIIVF